MKLAFTVPGQPKALARARHGQHGNVYTTDEDLAYQAEVWVCALKAGARQLQFADRPVNVTIRLFLTRPKKPKHPDFPIVRPDIDNFCKQFLDALRPLWVDDCQVIRLVAAKVYHPGEPRAEVEVEDL